MLCPSSNIQFNTFTHKLTFFFRKDKLILISLQNTNKSLLNIKRNMARDKSSTRWNEKTRTDLDSGKGKNAKDVPEMKKFETEKNR